MSGFKNFILRGNLVELAVAFIMGGAFATVVSSFTAVILGFVSRVTGGTPNFDGLTVWKKDGEGIPVGPFLTALVAFVILAAVLYFFVVMPYQRAKDRFFPPEVVEAGVSEEVALLTQIRDALTGHKGGTPPV